MTEIYACTDCGAEIDFDARAEHMKTEHGVSYGLADDWQEAYRHVPSDGGRWAGGVCPQCGETEPCDRAKALEGATAE